MRPNRSPRPPAADLQPPLGAGALIRWLLANGYTMLQIRTMFPGWFLSDPAPGG